MFDEGGTDRACFTRKSFEALLEFIAEGAPSYWAPAAQAGTRWSSLPQKVALRNAIAARGIVTPSCLWAVRELRGTSAPLYQEYDNPEISLMQILLLREADPARALPFLIERFVTRRDASEELRSSSKLCVMRILDEVGCPDLLRKLQARYPGVDLLLQWRPGIPGRNTPLTPAPHEPSLDFSYLVRSIHDMRELSSLTRVLYLASSFYVPLSEREWRSLLLGASDRQAFSRLVRAQAIERVNGGFILTSDANRCALVKQFLYEKYEPAKESVRRNKAERMKEERDRRVRSSELDRRALEIVPDGIICLDASGLLYYMNPAAEKLLEEHVALRERLFGKAPIEEALRNYSRESVLAGLTKAAGENGDGVQVFGDRASLTVGGRKFEVELGARALLLRDTTDQYLIEQEVGKLYRHELKAALDVMGAGIDAAKELIASGKTQEALPLLEQVLEKRVELGAMLEERMDFIRLHSDVFRIQPGPVNLNLLLDRCVANYREAAGAKRVTIESNHLLVEGALVRGEERFLMRALDNILRNAVKFAPEGGKVRIRLESDSGDQLVRIEDNGPGVAPENLGKIFQLGFTTGGAGRGLYIARRIVKAHGGRIEVKSGGDRGGAVFTVRLPMLVEA
jgi:signal transduction histidine kinase/PAS domain-containing protein